MSPRFGHQNNIVSNHLPLWFSQMTSSDSILVPVVGMLCANAITGVSKSLAYILKELWCVVSPAPIDRVPTLLNSCSEISDTIETLPGASRLEACRPLAIEALRLGLMPTINQMRYVTLRSTHDFLLIPWPHLYPW
jgi:ABC-type iron transport system FetAB permease component